MADNKKTLNDKRTYLYDNVKYILILMVVLGHLIEKYTEQSSMNHQYLFLMIYMVHMPLFFFLSGLFQKKYSETRTLNENKVLNLVILFYIYKCLNYVRGMIVGKPTKFHIFWEDGIPWFVWVMAAFMILMYLFRNVHPVVLIGLNIVLACVAGYDNTIGDTLCLSRTIVYFPFYALGYYLTPEQVLNFTRKKVVKGLAVIIFLALIIMCWRHFEWMYQLRHLFTGRNPLNDWDMKHGAWILRIFCYLVTLIEGVCIITLVPDIHIPIFTKTGQQTMRIYFWHLFFIKIMMYKGVGDIIVAYGRLQYPIWLLLGIALTLIFALPIFGIPTDYVMKLKLLKKNK